MKIILRWVEEADRAWKRQRWEESEGRQGLEREKASQL